MRKKLIAGNWKMYKNIASAEKFAEEFKKIYTKRDGVELAFCAPFLQLQAAKAGFAGTGIAVGAQNCHFEDEGAFTGEISVPMLAEVGVEYCIVGHSERRQYFAETDETVNKKLKKLLPAGILPILCVGEVLEQREAGVQEEVVKNQVVADFAGISAEDAKKVVIAYEPVWAVGTGKTATAAQAQEMCAFIRGVLAELYGKDTAEEVLIQYGGSVKPENASEILNMPDIDGALVGGASLVPEKFIKIAEF